jgi:hypothetical protein
MKMSRRYEVTMESLVEGVKVACEGRSVIETAVDVATAPPLSVARAVMEYVPGAALAQFAL